MGTLAMLLSVSLLNKVLATVMPKTNISDTRKYQDDFHSTVNDHVSFTDEALQKISNMDILNKTFGTNNIHVTMDDYVTLVHGDVKQRIQMKIPISYPSFLDPSVTILSTNT